MESVCWPPSHCEALKEFLTRGMSHRDAAHAINARFGTAYSRSAALGRALRWDERGGWDWWKSGGLNPSLVQWKRNGRSCRVQTRPYC